MPIYRGDNELTPTVDPGTLDSVYIGDQKIWPDDGFNLNDLGMRLRMKAPAVGPTFPDEGSEGGTWNMSASTENGPFGDNANLGYGVILPADIDALYRTAPQWLTATQTFTTCFWAKVQPGGPLARICLSGANAGSYRGAELKPWGNGVNRMIRIGTGGGEVEQNRQDRFYSGITDTRDGTYRHFTYTCLNGSPLDLFIDGIQQIFDRDEGSGQTIGFGATNNLRTNALSWTDITAVAWGTLSDLRMYDRELSGAEIISIAAGES